MKKILIIQTAFIGDVILATSIVEKLHQYYPEGEIDFLLRKGNEGLFKEHPYINEVLIWDKKTKKYENFKKIIHRVRAAKYDTLVNLQRYSSSGVITAISGATQKIGFKKNPLSFLFTQKFDHKIGDGTHEIERNQLLIAGLTDNDVVKPKLYPSGKDFDDVKCFTNENYVCIAPTSVWFTKQLPKEKWVEIINKTDEKFTIYLLGGPDDSAQCEKIRKESKHKTVLNLAGKLSFLASAALIKNAKMNHVNDSAPLHLASAMNAAVTAYFCSTVSSFGFGPLSDQFSIKEVSKPLKCRPCGLHGKNKCPEGHFNCAHEIPI